MRYWTNSGKQYVYLFHTANRAISLWKKYIITGYVVMHIPALKITWQTDTSLNNCKVKRQM